MEDSLIPRRSGAGHLPSAVRMFLIVASTLTALPCQSGPFEEFEAERHWPLLIEPLPKCDTCGFGSGNSFVYTLPADTMRAGRCAAGIRFDWQEIKPYSDAQLLQFSSQGVGAHSIDRSLVLRAGVAYGVADDLTVGLDLPFVNHRDLREASVGGAPDIESNGDQSGFGDMSLFGQWRCLEDAPADRFVSLYGGVRLPTGETHLLASDGSLLEPDHQPGSGSVDPFFGVAVAQGIGGTTFGASAVYTLAGDGSQNSNLGDVLRVNFGLGWLPEQPDDARVTCRFMLEVTSEWHQHMHIDGAVDENTGGVQMFIAPGVRLRWLSGLSWFASVGLPVLQNLDGEQAATRFRFASGFGVSF
jgi:hypothetical protein